MEAVNDWVRKNTKGRIEKILEQDDPMSQACLVNALTFDAEWPVAYTPESVYDGTFFTSDGSRQVVPFLHSVEESYFELAGAEGFVRPYAGERYVFAGLLPAEGTTPEELLQALDGEALLNALGEPQTEEVHVAIPKLIAATDRMQLKEPLRAMGHGAGVYRRCGFLPPCREAAEDRFRAAQGLAAARRAGDAGSRRDKHAHGAHCSGRYGGAEDHCPHAAVPLCDLRP